MIKYIKVSLDFEAVHNWPDCDIEEVSFLKQPHRHVFKIHCMKKVDHNNRDIEFIKLKREIQNYCNHHYHCKNIGSMSCEDIAEELIKVFDLQTCAVLEDGENGAFLDAE